MAQLSGRSLAFEPTHLAVWRTGLAAARQCAVYTSSGLPLHHRHDGCSAPAVLLLHPPTKEKTLNISLSLGPLVSLIAGILILLVPRLLNYIVAIYLIVIGLIGLFGAGSLRI
jgi:hypothetical protein